MIFNFEQFINEVNIADLKKIQSNQISSLFNISLEIELETDDTEGTDKEYTPNQVEKVIEMIRNRVYTQLLRFKNIDKNNLSKYNLFLNYLMDEIKISYDDEDELEIILDLEKYKDIIEYSIVELVEPLVSTYFMGENIFYLKNKLKSNLPTFWKKWKDKIKYEIDNTLERGIEISMKTFIIGIEEAISFIKDFYSDYDSQTYWKFDQTTGIHINIGVRHKKDWNIIKGVLILNDTYDNTFLFKGMEWRVNNEFTNSVKDLLLALPKKDREVIKSDIKGKDIKYIEQYFNDYLHDKIKEEGYKKFGFNITNIKNDNYVEFRHPGGEISEKDLIEQLLLFSYVVYCMTNSDFKKKEYQKKLYKFLNQLFIF